MPTRLVVMLHRRKSARAADPTDEAARRTAASAKRDHAPVAAATSRGSASADEDNAAVIDVGSRGSRADEVAQSLEEICRIVVAQEGARIKTEALGAHKGGLVDDGPGGIAGRAAAAVRAVRVRGQCRDGLGALEGNGEGEGIFLVRAATAIPLDRDREFP